MLYREAGQFKTSYDDDQAVFPIRQDRWGMAFILAVAYVALPFFATDYFITSIMIPFLIYALAAIGLNLLTGYCGQVSLGTGGFMAVGAYAAYNLAIRVPELNLIVVFILSGGAAAMVGVVFGIPSLRIKGFYLAVATLAAQFFLDWAFSRIKWFTNYTPSGSVAAPPLDIFGFAINTPDRRYFLILVIVTVMALAAKTWCGAVLAARGWRSATWTSPPRSSASVRCAPSFPPLPSPRSSPASPVRSGPSSISAPGSRSPSTSTARSFCCSW